MSKSDSCQSSNFHVLKMYINICVFFILLAMPLRAEADVLNYYYCGLENCYEILGVTREASRGEIARAYRKMAKQFHPDTYRDEAEKVEAETNFKRVTTAYEILKDDFSRMDYDYLLDSPEEVYSHYYRYYSRQVTPHVDVRVVIAISITVISAIQYFIQWHWYNNAVKHLLTVPNYRNRALLIAEETGQLERFRKTRKMKKAEANKETEEILQKVTEIYLEIHGGYAKPSIKNVLWLQLFLLPSYLARTLFWNICWAWKHQICNLPYSDEEKLYLIRKHMKVTQHRFNIIEESEKQMFLRKELWIRENFDAWLEEKGEEQNMQLRENSILQKKYQPKIH